MRGDLDHRLTPLLSTFGRRNLLLTTYPLMGLCLLFTGLCFLMPAGEARLGCIATGIYLFMVFYSPGEGPVPFTYSAEAFPLYIRGKNNVLSYLAGMPLTIIAEYGMAFATATTWGFNFVLSLTWPALEANFTPTGAFGQLIHRSRILHIKPSEVLAGTPLLTYDAQAFTHVGTSLAGSSAISLCRRPRP